MLRGEASARVDQLARLVELCLDEQGASDLPSAIAGWIREEATAIAVLCWQDGCAEGERSVGEGSFPTQPL